MHPSSRIALAMATAAAVAVLVLVAAVLLSGSSDSSSPARSAGSAADAGGGFDGAALPGGMRAPDFTLTDQDGRALSPSHYRGRVIVLSFLYSSCGAPCRVIAQQIRGALDDLAAPVPVLIVSVDGAADTPASVGRFLARVSLTGRVHYLTGSAAQLRAVWRAYRVKPPGRDPSAFGSAAPVILIDRRGDERVLFEIEQLTPDALAHDIDRLAGESIGG
jgi:protein SCO1